MEFIFTIWVIVIILASALDIRYGMAALVPYLILVPIMFVEIGGRSLSWNFTNLLLFVFFCIQARRRKWKFSWKPLAPFLLYFGISLIFMLFQYDIPLGWEINYWRQTVMQSIIPCAVLWNIVYNNPQWVPIYRYSVILSVVIAVMYGLFLTFTPGLNPYIMGINDIVGSEYDMDYFLAEGEGRMFGRISSCFLHPMTFAFFLGLSIIYVYLLSNKIPYVVSIFLFVLLSAGILTCGVRSVIGGVGVAVVYFLYKTRKNKRILTYAILSVALLSYVILLIPDLQEYLGSMTDQNSDNVQGSSLNMRFDQFWGCIVEISDCFLFGKGFGWTSYYIELNTVHPTIFCFESLIFVILCNSGLAGMLLWIVYNKRLYRFNNKRTNGIVLNCLVVFYLSYACITGEYGYMKYYMLFYILLLSETTPLQISIKKRVTRKSVWIA